MPAAQRVNLIRVVGEYAAGPEQAPGDAEKLVRKRYLNQLRYAARHSCARAKTSSLSSTIECLKVGDGLGAQPV